MRKTILFILVVSFIIIISGCVKQESIKEITLNKSKEVILQTDFEQLDQTLVYDKFIIVLGSAEKSIKGFDLDGNLLFTVDKLGQGPGEIQYPNAIYATGKGISIVDAMKGKEMLFSYEGKFIDEYKLPYMSFALNREELPNNKGKFEIVYAYSLNKKTSELMFTYSAEINNKIVYKDSTLLTNKNYKDNIIPIYAINKDWISVASVDYDNVNASFYDLSGNKEGNVYAEYSLEKIEECDKKEIKVIKKLSSTNETSSSTIKDKSNYKIPVNKMLAMPDNSLGLVRVLDDKTEILCYDKSGKILSKIYVPILTDNIIVRNNELLVFDVHEEITKMTIFKLYK